MIKKSFDNGGVRSFAIFSDCERYRYVLRRVLDDNKNRVVFIGLNPSTADEVKNDPTVSRMISFSKSLSFGSVSVCNLFAFRATRPSNLKKAEDPIGKDNDKFIFSEIKNADKVIACWGNHGKFLNRSNDFLKNLDNFNHFGFTKIGEPRHILYLKKDIKLKTFSKKLKASGEI